MRAVWKLLLLAALSAGCASLGGGRSTEKFVIEITGYRLWKEVYYFDGRTEAQWMLVCRTISPAKRAAKETDIVVTSRDLLYRCPTGTVLECAVERRAVSAWERIARRESAKVDVDALRSRALELERDAVALERAYRAGSPGSSEAALAREAAVASSMAAELYK